MMGQLYRDGKGVKQSYEMARMLYELAAQQGDAVAMYDLGRLYQTGRGVEQSYERAVEYYEQAAQLGQPDAQYNLGIMYAKGKSIRQDFTKAKALWTKAASQGCQLAIETLTRVKEFEERTIPSFAKKWRKKKNKK